MLLCTQKSVLNVRFKDFWYTKINLTKIWYNEFLGVLLSINTIIVVVLTGFYLNIKHGVLTGFYLNIKHGARLMTSG